MQTIRFTMRVVTATTFMLVLCVVAQAQATRTWVSGVGDDANPCSRTAPCKTFAGAISKTATDGEIDALDPGGFGTVTITKGITIAGDGTLAGILNAGTTGVIINATATSVVYLRNISINGAGTGLNGIRFLAGKALHVENVNIYGQMSNTAGNGHGILVALGATGSGVFVKNTNIKTCFADGINVATSTGFVAGVLDGVRLEALPTGLVIGNNAFISVRDSVINLATSTGVSITGSGTPTGSFDNVMINNNPTAINVGASAIMNLSNSVLENNTTAIVSAAPQVNLRSSGNNRLLGNASDGATMTVILPK